MAIEIGQLLIKSTVLQSGYSDNMGIDTARESDIDPEVLKQEIVADCRALLIEMFREQKER